MAIAFVLLPALAILQYRWIGRISQVDRERMYQHLTSTVEQLRDNLDREVAVVYDGLLMDYRDNSGADALEQRAARISSWRETSRHSRMVRSFYVIRVTPDQPHEVFAYQMKESRFEPATLPEAFEIVRSGGPIALLRNPPALVAPRFCANESVPQDPPPQRREPQREGSREGRGPGPEWRRPPRLCGWVIAELDTDYIATAILPGLLERYMRAEFQASVIDNGPSAKTIAGEEMESEDLTAPILQLRPWLVPMRFGGRGSFGGFRMGGPRGKGPPPRNEGGGPGFGRGPGGPGPDGDRGPGPGDRGLGFGDRGPGFGERGPGPGPGPGRDVRNPPDRPFGAPEEGLWTLRVKHSLGSLDAAVERSRRLNLGISLAILGLLAACMVILNRSAQRERKLAQLQMDFVAGVSHELRTPLAATRALSENLADGVVPASQVQYYGTLLRDQTHSLADTVEQILRLAGIQADRMHLDLQTVDVREILERAIEAAKPEIENAQCTVECDIQADLPPLAADSASLVHCVRNLLSNAAKYGDHYAPIRVTARRAKRLLTPEIWIRVEDHGAGIDKEELREIFKPFHRGKKAISDQVHGLGLGLALVKRIVEAHGGRIEVESKPGKGSRFTLCFPAAGSEARAEQQELAPGDAG